jgi:hypothetical protein
MTRRQPLADKSRRSSTHRDAVERVREAESFAVNLPVVGRVRIPRPEQLAYYGALAALAAVEIIDWPIALAIGAGHALASNHHNRVAQELGEALEDA